MSEKSLNLPRFAITASQFLHDRDLPDHLYRTYARITSLAWQQAGTGEGYEITLYELEALWGISVRDLRRHIAALKARGCLDWETRTDAHDLHRLAFYPLWPEPPAAGCPCQVPPLQEEPAPEPTGGTLAALSAFGVEVEGGLAQQVTTLPHVTPALVRAWGTHLQQQPGVRNLPGLLLHVLQRQTEPPEAQGAPGPAPAALPEDLEQALCELGWSGDGAWSEVSEIASTKGPDFVRAWVRYVADRPELGAGYLRTCLRGATWPSPGKDPEARRRERRLRQWEKHTAGGPTLPARPKAPAGPDIAPETMEVWGRAQADLALQMTRATYDAWLRGARLLSAKEGRATLGVQHPRAVGWVQNRLAPVIVRTLSRHLGRPVEDLAVVPLSETKEET